jgi:triphosphatase
MLREGSGTGFTSAAPRQLIRGSNLGIRREHGEFQTGRANPAKHDYGVVEETMSAGEAFRAVCLACVQHLEANREGMLAGTDPEFLHQMRVALRRLRTAFAVFAAAIPEAASAPLLAELRWLQRALGEARDWDVFAAHTLRPALQRHPRRRGLRVFERACGELSAAAVRTARRAVESRRYRNLVRELRTLCYAPEALPRPPARRAPLRRFAVAVLASLHGEVRKRGRRLGRQDPEALHRLRNAARKLRYAILFLAPLFEKERVRPLAKSVESLQQTLGRINDCAVARGLVARARAEARGPGRRKARRSLARRIEAARKERRKALKKEWKAFRRAEEFWGRPGAGAA